MEYLQFDIGVWERLLSLVAYDALSPMTLVSGLFLLFFTLFFVGYICVAEHRHLRTVYVTLISLYFYYKLSGLYVLLLLFVAMNDYAIGRIVGRCCARGKRGRGWVALSVTINLAILAYFKVAGLFADMLNGFYGAGTLNFEVVAIPAGVSFFVFQSIAYVVDISRGTIRPLRNPIDYLFLLSFFPKMFLGPLVRNSEFIPQIERRECHVGRDDVGRAAVLIARGILKYAVIARCVGTLLVEPAFAGELGSSGVVTLMAIYGFTLQIYCDFSGYSDVAIGIALLMGFRLPDNFDAPYKSATVTEFWHRWHISLSTWLRDYLYIPLGGSRRGQLRTYLNLFLTMLLGGLWHGASVTFVLWGAYHGVALALHKLWLRVVPAAKAVGGDMRVWWRLPATLLTFHVVAFGWLLFAAEDVVEVQTMLHNIVYNFSLNDILPTVEQSGFALAVMAVGYLLHLAPKRFDAGCERLITRGGLVVWVVVIVVAVWLTMQCDAMLAATADVESMLPIYAAF